jgi:small GTP-binding protein
MKKEEENKNKYEFKIVTLGDPGVGKTSIFRRFVEDNFDPNQLSTLGINLSTKILKIKNKELVLKLIDTGGQEKYRAIAASYFRRADVILFVFDLNNSGSFDSIQYWLDFFEENNTGTNIKNKFLIGNKNDLEQKVDQDLIDKLTEKNNILYMSTSAKTKHQIEQLFEYIGGELCKLLENNTKNNNGKKKSTGKVLSKTNMKKDKKKCC